MRGLRKNLAVALICAFLLLPQNANAKVVDKLIDYTADGAYYATKYSLKGAWYVTELAAKGAKVVTLSVLHGVKDAFDSSKKSRPASNPKPYNDYGDTLPPPPPIID